MSGFAQFDLCHDCGHPRWAHDAENGACLGYNAFLEGRSGCPLFECRGFRPRQPTNREGWTFRLSPQEADAASRFIEKHKCPHRGKYKGAIGGGTSYIFTPTSIGEMASVKCCCGAQEFLSEHI